ncbi:hypothetical protein [Arsenophonus endosymbiont of Aleurodicus floccissimus]|uniref:hypothetical protein n=1 Tax=Arsenophonus endosymbiont of Aleurodicus floccissimus TaxID=2152761 RepID=UPI000E6B3273|nr:hypothetical protein [Arsenophonus endosymbiont of Aleurodicus floccissimus]
MRQKNQFLTDTLKQLDQPVYDYLVTTEKTPIYENTDEKSTVIGFLSADLRYPVQRRKLSLTHHPRALGLLLILVVDWLLLMVKMFH